jgi:hypothetical protein
MDENLKIEDHVQKLEDLLKRLINDWHLYVFPKSCDLNILKSLPETKPTLGNETDLLLLNTLAEELTHDDWLNLGTLIQEFRAGGDTRERCMRRRRTTKRESPTGARSSA